MIAPTNRQVLVLRAIYDAVVSTGLPPTQRQIAEATGIASTNGVRDHLRALVRKGLVARTAMISRGTRLTPKALEVLGAACPLCGGAAVQSARCA